MKNHNFSFVFSVLSVLIVLINGCTTSPTGLGINKVSGFEDLPFPSRLYTPGQIVEIFSSKKVEISLDPQINWDQLSSSPGWDIAQDKNRNLESNLNLEVNKILKSSAGYDSKYHSKIEMKNTTTVIVPKNIIYSELKKRIESDVPLKEFLKVYVKNGTRFNVITQVLTADVEFKIEDGSGNAVKVDTEVLEKINSKIGGNFARSADSNTAIKVDKLVVGFHTDPRMVEMLLRE